MKKQGIEPAGASRAWPPTDAEAEKYIRNLRRRIKADGMLFAVRAEAAPLYRVVKLVAKAIRDQPVSAADDNCILSLATQNAIHKVLDDIDFIRRAGKHRHTTRNYRT